jgi:hypothetical protein
MPLRLGLCAWLLVVVGCLQWCIALVAGAAHFLHAWPLQPWAIAAGLIGGILLALGSALGREKRVAMFLNCVLYSSGLAGLLLIFIIARQWILR